MFSILLWFQATTSPIIASSSPKLVPDGRFNYSISKERVKDFINTTAVEYGVSVQLVESIAWSESRFDTNAKNSSSTASGPFQMLNSTFENFCIKKYGLASSVEEKNSYTTQTLCAVRMIKDGYLNAWDASSSAWKPLADSS